MRLRTRRSCLLLYCIPYYKYGERFYEVKALFKPDFPRNMIEKWSRLPYVSKVLSLVLECMSVIVCWKSKSSERDLLKRNQNKNKIIKQRSLLHYTILNFHQISYTKCLIIVQLIVDLKVEEVWKIRIVNLNITSCLLLNLVGGDATLRSCGLVTSSVLGQPRVENWDKTLEKKQQCKVSLH